MPADAPPRAFPDLLARFGPKDGRQERDLGFPLGLEKEEADLDEMSRAREGRKLPGVLLGDPLAAGRAVEDFPRVFLGWPGRPRRRGIEKRLSGD